MADTSIACVQQSLERLNQQSVDLYQQHWPGFPVLNSWSNDAFCRGLAKCQKLGLAKAVGVSNFNEKRLRRAHGIIEIVRCSCHQSLSSIDCICKATASPAMLHYHKLLPAAGGANEVLNERAVAVMKRMSDKLTGRDFLQVSSTSTLSSPCMMTALACSMLLFDPVSSR